MMFGIKVLQIFRHNAFADGKCEGIEPLFDQMV